MKILGTEYFEDFRRDCAKLFNADAELRADGPGNAAFLARELEYVSAQTYDVLYNPIKGRQIVPFNTEAPSGAETYSYDQYDQVGVAEFVTNYGTEPPRVDAFKKRFTASFHSIWTSYAYSVQDIRAAAMAASRGSNTARLDVKRAQIARLTLEKKLDDVIAVGDTTRSIKGLTNSTDIPFVTTTAGTWASASTAEILADLSKLTNAPEQATAGLFVADTLLLPLSKKSQLQTPYSTVNPMTLLKAFLDVTDNIKQIVWWNRLDTASAIGGPRAMALTKNPMVLEFLMSQDFEDFPPEIENLETKVIVHERIGGMSFHYPLACAKMDLDA